MKATLLDEVKRVVRRDPADLQSFGFGKGVVGCIPISLPHLVTVWHATQVADIETFVHVSGSGYPLGVLADLPDGPTAAERDASRYRAVAKAMGSDGAVSCTQIETVNGYSFTAMASAETGTASCRASKSEAFRRLQGFLVRRLSSASVTVESSRFPWREPMKSDGKQRHVWIRADPLM